MAKHWCVCWICGANFSSLMPGANDCGRTDEQHRKARGT